MNKIEVVKIFDTSANKTVIPKITAISINKFFCFISVLYIKKVR